MEIPVKEFMNRVDRIRKNMMQENIDALLIYADAWRAGDIKYVANYKPFNNSLFWFPSYMPAACVIIPNEGNITLFVSTMCVEEAAAFSWIEDVRSWVELSRYLKEFKEKTRPKRLGITNKYLMPIPLYESILKEMANVKVDETDMVTRLRGIKSDLEVKLLAKAGEIACIGMQAAIDMIDEGKKEKEIARVAETAMLSHGGEGLGFDTLVGSGRRSEFIIARPTMRRIEDGDMIYVDLSGLYCGYASDLSRAIGFGNISDEKREILETMIEANEKGRKTVKPGVKTSEIDKKVKTVIVEAGYEFKQVGLHATGFEFGEAVPSCSGPYDLTLEPNMTFVVLSSIFVPGVGGGRIETLMAVTRDGGKILTPIEHAQFLSK